MTKPNELTPEQAIERVEGGFHHACDWRPETEPGCGACPACLDNAALRLVIEDAKRPTALSGEERKELESLLEHGDSSGEFLSASHQAAIETALSLASPGSPFTQAELGYLRYVVTAMEVNDRTHDAPLALLAKLDAMLEDK